jgi:hypothetical protein
MDKHGLANVETIQPTLIEYLDKILIELRVLNEIISTDLDVDLEELREDEQSSDDVEF